MSQKICDIVIISWNKLQLLNDCVASILKHTQLPVNLYIIDNASTRDVREYCRNLKGTENVEVHIVQNEKNEGFVRAVNQGFKLSQAPYMCICNNDIVMTEKWLDELIDISRKDSQIGVLNPQSSTFGQKPGDVNLIDSFARDHIFKKRGRYVEAGQCIGFCMMIKKETIKKVGYFNEDLNTVFFEDTEYCHRAREVGFKCVIALGAYVYHHEHQSVKDLHKSDRYFAENKKKIEKKWGVPKRILVTAGFNYRTNRQKARDRMRAAIELSRRNNFVYFYQKGRFGDNDIDKYYDDIGLIRFLNVQIFFSNSLFFGPAVFFRIFFRKRKKKFDYCIIDSALLRSMINSFHFFHQTRAISEMV